jgi:hypothetical protein
VKGSSQALIDVGLDRFWRHKDGGLNRWKGSWRFPVVTHHSRTRLRPQSRSPDLGRAENMLLWDQPTLPLHLERRTRPC